jgi:hypothetical protein
LRAAKVAGLLVQHLGFHITFYAFAGLAALGAAVYTKVVPETMPGGLQEDRIAPDGAAAGAEAV